MSPTVWRHRHLLDVDDLSWPEIELVMRTADGMAEAIAGRAPVDPVLRGVGVTILF